MRRRQEDARKRLTEAFSAMSAYIQRYRCQESEFDLGAALMNPMADCELRLGRVGLLLLLLMLLMSGVRCCCCCCCRSVFVVVYVVAAAVAAVRCRCCCRWCCSFVCM